MTELELIKAFGHWGEHPDIPLSEWVEEVKAGNTRLGYWKYVEYELRWGIR